MGGLVRSNIASSPAQQMSIPETLSQISTFIVAGFETTSTALSWTLYSLAQSPQSQTKLREALRSIPTHLDNDAMVDAIQALPYLDSVLRESLRLNSPVTNTMRVCTRDHDLIPTKDEYVGVDGVRRSGIEVKKWDIISVPIQAVNKDVGIWGEDAAEFRWVRFHRVVIVPVPSGVRWRMRGAGPNKAFAPSGISWGQSAGSPSLCRSLVGRVLAPSSMSLVLRGLRLRVLPAYAVH